MLKTETNTRTMEKRILKAAYRSLGKRGLKGTFEHGQWWVYSTVSGAQWSVVDATGGNSVDGFDFEPVAYGKEE